MRMLRGFIDIKAKFRVCGVGVLSNGRDGNADDADKTNLPLSADRLGWIFYI